MPRFAPLLLLAFAAQTTAFTFTSLKSNHAFTATPELRRSNFVAAPAKRVARPQSDNFSRRRVVITAGWGPDPIWETCTILSTTSASKDCVEVTVEVTGKQVEDYKIPGQYCQVKVAGDDEAKAIFLAIASAPESSSDEEKKDDSTCRFEFLIKRSDNNGWIMDAAAGSKVDVSQVLGGGFPIEENLDGFKYDFPTQNVLLFACGSGIAPIRAAIESGKLDITPEGKGGRSARLYYGVRSPEDMVYSDRFSAWEAGGVQVVPVVSQPEGTDWAGRTGYVQTALEEDGVAIPRNSGALLCGMKGMAESVTDLLTKAGMFEGRILTNF
eukprot:CAMPEP_0195542312 /NCGR_PEP_ID=MMETSP0794_2-20130614/51536_1 /TAXON_ID=515487 /ORGANISM="Stephanopyxis turris, Strain CCMP 815" /LENGTH=325 /DNA_ID=CAMNT_0040676443 /DNA_START=30 /DNA_END=1007 /DNA_ORIENTATION=+